MILNYYCYQTTNNFERLLEQKDAKNISKVAILIFLTIGMLIRLTRLLEDCLPNAKYDSKKKFRKRCTNVDYDNDGKIEEAMTADNDKEDDKKNPWEKNRQLKKEKQRLMQAIARARACQ